MSEGLFLVATSSLPPWIRRIITNGSERPNGNKEERSRCCRRRVTTGERELKSGNIQAGWIARGSKKQTEGNGRIRGSPRVREKNVLRQEKEREIAFGASRAPI